MTRFDWPDGKKFAFTIWDDTDLMTADRGRPVYDLLTKLGLRTTKSVWVRRSPKPHVGGSDCTDDDYREWVLQLQRDGHEIALHNAADGSSTREETFAAFKHSEEWFGHAPHTIANHSGNADAVYSGNGRLSGAPKLVYRVLTRDRNRGRFAGEDRDSPYFWGDLALRVPYFRSFVYSDINTLKVCPMMPYYDQTKPFVAAWFASSEGPTVTSFCNTISPENQDRLETERGLCIMYAHFGAGFVRDGNVDPTFDRLIRRLAGKDGWFVPVVTILDWIAATRGIHILRPYERWMLECRWLAEKVRMGKTS